MRKLYRSEHNRVFAGVMGGLGDYFLVDPVLLRLLYVFATVFTGVVPGVIAYIFAIIVVPPERPAVVPHDDSGV